MTNEELRAELQKLADTYGVTLEDAFEQFGVAFMEVVSEHAEKMFREAIEGKATSAPVGMLGAPE